MKTKDGEEFVCESDGSTIDEPARTFSQTLRKGFDGDLTACSRSTVIPFLDGFRLSFVEFSPVVPVGKPID